MKSEGHEIIQRVAIAERVALRLKRLLEESAESEDWAEERRWLAVAEERVAQHAAELCAALDQSLALPELRALRQERELGLEREWLDALRELFSGLLQQLGETSPLVEALFPHRRFEKLERSAAQRAYRAQFATRRASSYVCRMAADPDYPFLAPLLEPMDRVTQALTEMEGELTEEEAQALRATISQRGERLKRSLRQARALAEAALVDQPERVAELGFDARPRSRPPRESP